jgi:hypothetical protein
MSNHRGFEELDWLPLNVEQLVLASTIVHDYFPTTHHKGNALMTLVKQADMQCPSWEQVNWTELNDSNPFVARPMTGPKQMMPSCKCRKR